MGCFCDQSESERERKNETNMVRKKETEINPELDQQNIIVENQNNKNEELEIFHQKKINLFNFKDEKGNVPITKNNFEEIKKTESDERDKLKKNEEKNIKQIKEDDINKKEKAKKQESQNIIKDNNQKKEEEKDQLKFDKDLCKSIASSLPKRTKIQFQPFKDLLKTKTDNLSDKEKSFVIFLWICDNIAYDVDSYFAGRDVDCTPKGVYKNGSSVCSGYSRLYKDFADYIGLEVECVNCYAKGVGYSVGDKLTSTNHEYNVIKLNNKWYPIDSTWGAGHTEGKKYIKCYNEFYFLANPELLIKTHFPDNDKWQLTKKKYTLEEFLKWPQIKSNFYTFGFEKCFPEEGLIELKNRNNQKFIVYGNNMDQKGATCNIYLLEGNCYMQQLNVEIVNFYNDRFEIDAIFNKKGKYKVEIFGNNDRGKHYLDMLEYAVNVENNAIKKLAFPTFYAGKENINVIEPMYDNLRSGAKVKFRIMSTLNDIIIIDNDWHYLKRNAQGYFEFETNIKSKKGDKVIIGNKTESGSCGYLVQYNVV